MESKPDGYQESGSRILRNVAQAVDLLRIRI